MRFLSVFIVYVNCITDHVVERDFYWSFLLNVVQHVVQLVGIKLHYANTTHGRTDEQTQHVATSQHLDMSRCWDVAKCSSIGGELLYSKLATCCVCSFVRSFVGDVVFVRLCSGVWHYASQRYQLLVRCSI